MKENLPKNIIIDPTRPQNSQLFFSAIKSLDEVSQYIPFTISDPQTHQKIELAFTHPMFRFEKPVRISAKTGMDKPAGQYMAVYEPKPLGAGEFGAVYPVLGVWKLNDNSWIFKTKSNPDKERVVKTNAALKPSKLKSSIAHNYRDEQRIGKWVQHMSYKYPVVSYNKKAFLLMRWQKGKTLESIIDKANSDPDYLSITDRLKITVNLLNEFHNQIQGVILPPKRRSQPPPIVQDILIHSDIKPANTLVADDYSIKIIDYGLAKRSSEYAQSGTSLYMDPTILDGSKISTDAITDLYSLARTIAELWGDRSGDALNKYKEILERSKSNRLVDLLSNISGLTEAEQQAIRNTITAMISYDETKRITREEALTIFLPLLTNRLEHNNYLLNINLSRPIEELSAQEILDLLKSSKVYEFLDKFTNEPTLFRKVIKELRHRLLEVNESILSFINTHIYNFTSTHLLLFLLHENNIIASQVKLLIKLGASVDEVILKNWINRTSEEKQELRWASICRELYQAIPNAHKIVDQIEDKNSFKSIYCQHFLINKEASTDDRANVRLVKRHLEIAKNNESNIQLIKESLSNLLLATPFATAILASDLINKPSQSLLIADDSHLIQLNKNIVDFNNLIKKVFDLKSLAEMNQRNAVIRAMQSLVHKMMYLIGFDWQSALAQLTDIESQIEFITDLDRIHKQLNKYLPWRKYNSLSVEIDYYYQSPKDNSGKLSYLLKGSDLLKEIDRLKNGLLLFVIKIPLDPLLEEQFNSFIKKPAIKEPRQFYTSIKHHHAVYTQFSALVKHLNNQLTDLSDHEQTSVNILTKLHNELEQVLPKEHVANYMAQVSNRTLQIIEKARLNNSADEGYYYTFFRPIRQNEGRNSTKYDPEESSDYELTPLL